MGLGGSLASVGLLSAAAPPAGAATTATHFVVSAPSTVQNGVPFNVTVTAKDASNNTDTGYRGSVHFISTNDFASLPANYTFTAADAGTHIFSATLNFQILGGTATITVYDRTNHVIRGTSNFIRPTPGPASRFFVGVPPRAIVGAPFAFEVTAFDKFGYPTTDYGGTMHFSSHDSRAVLPADSTLTNGVGTFSATFNTPGGQVITAVDTVHRSIGGTSNIVEVRPPVATHFAVTAPSTAIAGSPFSFTVTALGANNGIATDYGGTIQFYSSYDRHAVLPANSTLTHGVGTFSATLNTAGLHTIGAFDTADGFINGVAIITVEHPPATHFFVSSPGSVTAGVAAHFTVTALDRFNHTVTGYRGTVHFTSTAGRQASLPRDYTFTSTDAGTHTFAASLGIAGNQTITATDTSNSAITGTSKPWDVIPPSFFVSSSPVTAGSAFNFTVTVLDTPHLKATGYRGTVHFTSTDGKASLPGDYTFTSTDAGRHTFSATLYTVGPQTITVTDASHSSFTGTSKPFPVAKGAQAITFTSTAPTNASVGGPTYHVTATGGPSTSPVTYSIDPSARPVCSIGAPNTVSLTGEGTQRVVLSPAQPTPGTQPVLLGQGGTSWPPLDPLFCEPVEPLSVDPLFCDPLFCDPLFCDPLFCEPVDPLFCVPLFCEPVGPLFVDPLLDPLYCGPLVDPPLDPLDPLEPLPDGAPLCDELEPPPDEPDWVPPDPPGLAPAEADDTGADQPGTPSQEPCAGATPG